MATKRITQGAPGCCGWETDVNEVCGESDTRHLTGEIQVPKPLSDVTRIVRVDDHLCGRHAGEFLVAAKQAGFVEAEREAKQYGLLNNFFGGL